VPLSRPITRNIQTIKQARFVRPIPSSGTAGRSIGEFIEGLGQKRLVSDVAKSRLRNSSINPRRRAAICEADRNSILSPKIFGGAKGANTDQRGGESDDRRSLSGSFSRLPF
jgi:hypothetical protein